MKDKNELEELYILKGIAIIGLIIWHTYHTPLPLINSSFSNFLWKIIAEYAMPLFMFTSGFLFGISKKEISSLSSYVAFIRKKFKRIMIPYFAVWGIYMTAEFAAEFISGFTSLNYSVNPDFWKYILFNPIKGTALHLWFLHQLFIVFLIFPILNKMVKNEFVLFVLICSLWLIKIPSTVYFDLINLRIFIFFFSFGCLYANYDFDNINAYAKSLCLVFLGFLVLFSFQENVIITYFGTLGIKSEQFYLFLGNVKQTLGVIFFYYFAVVVRSFNNPLRCMLKFLGVYSVAIYLFHHISLGVVRIILLNILNVSDSMHVIASIIVFLSGMILPVLFAKYIINKFDFMPPLLLGIKKVPQFKCT